MNTLIHALRSGIEAPLAPLDALPPFWALTLISALSGVFMLWVVGKTTPQARVEVARSRMASAIYEIRLFLDSPARIVLSQVRLLGWSLAYVGYMMPAFLLLTLPLGLLYFHLDVRYGQAALPVHTPVLVTVEAAPEVDLASIAPGSLPDGVRVTAPPLRLPDERAVILRLVIDRPGTYTVPIQVGDETVDKQLDADPSALAVNPDRVSGWDLLASYGHEPPLSGDRGALAVSVVHPESSLSFVGFSGYWWFVYWLIVATVVALALRRPMGVTL
ncbi:MAG: hypothetical protein Tsb0020_18130 [Haliangiales bacterium]